LPVSSSPAWIPTQRAAARSFRVWKAAATAAETGGGPAPYGARSTHRPRTSCAWTMDNFIKDVRFGARMLVRNPGSTIISVLALSLGIGLTTMMFSIVYGAVLKGLPFERSEQLVNVMRTNPSENMERVGLPIHDFEDYRSQQRSFVDLAGYYTGSINVSGIERPERFDGAFISPQAFGLMGVRAHIGRTLLPEDAEPGAGRVMVLGYDAWQSRFGGDQSVLGRVVRANAVPTTIVGVMPPGFSFPVKEQVWVPLNLDAAALPRGEGFWISAIGRLRDDVDIASARAELNVIAARLAAEYPETNRGMEAYVRPFVEAFIGREPVTMLYTALGAVFMVLLIACANVTNLLISRAAARSREVGIRTAMGASTTRIVRQFLTESFILAVAGATVGLVIAWVGIRVFNNAIASTDPPFWIDIALHADVLLFVLAVTGLAALIAGAIPAWQAARSNVADVLKDESRGASSFRLGRISRGLVIAEIALSAGLLVGAGLMIKSVTQVRNIDYPFATAVFTARIALPEAQYADVESQRLFFEQLLPRLHELPGTEAIGLIQALPGTGSPFSRVAIEGTTYQEDRDVPNVRSILASPGAFDAYALPVRQGRGITEQDRLDALPVAVVSESFARRFFDGDAIGKRIRLGGRDSQQDWRTIVGIVPDTYLTGLNGNRTAETIYTPLAQGGARFMSVVARTRAGEPLSLSQPVRDAVLAIDGDLPIYFVQTLRTAIDQGLWFYAVFGSLFMIFGFVALFLAAVGLYGVMATSVSQRTREMGVRMALGAEGRDVLRLVMRQGLLQLVVGLVIGLALAVGVSSLLTMLLYDVNPRDPTIFGAIGLVLTVTAAAACFIPASRATRVDPMHALRYD
jgi:putative ABC transport system permease protein